MPTTPTVDHPVPPEPSPATTVIPAVPTLEEIERLKPEERRVFRGVDWDFYERLQEVVGERPGLRIAFDGRDLEIMPTGAFHDVVKAFGFRLIEIVTEELDIPSASAGSTTWSRPAIKRGIEADESFFFSTDKLAMFGMAVSRNSKDLADYPNPDLAIEVDLSEPRIDRTSIYAALRVPEIWRFTETGVTIEQWTDRGSYEDASRSAFLPIDADEVARWVLREDRTNLQDWKRRLRAWIRAELAGRRVP